MKSALWRFTDNLGSFESKSADQIKTLYFPLANETLMSSISPDLHGDIKTGQNSFLLTPVSRQDLVDLRSSRNFWVYINENKIWSATGVSKDLKQIQNDKFNLEAGLLWHKVSRENKDIGLKAEILSFVPATNEPVEIMQVKITNISSHSIEFIPTAAIPIYAHSANNIRDHRHVTSLLNRITLNKFGVLVKPTLVFDESGHRPNNTLYFVLGWDEKFNAPEYLYPTQEMFCGEKGDLEAPISVYNNLLPIKERIQGKDALGGLRFRKARLATGKSLSYIILMGITENKALIKTLIKKFNSLGKVKKAFLSTNDCWIRKTNQINLSTGNTDFDNWFRWVSIQPALRKIFGCSFLPDFDYGKGGRGWRDLWQDTLSLILFDPKQIRKLLVDNFSGVRIDGSNATIIAKTRGEFISDRNNMTRVWMDHGVWPMITLDLYFNETGDFDILFEEAPYFRNHQICRGRAQDWHWDHTYGQRLKTTSGKIYTGTILEHLLIQNLVQFFNVGSHNYVRLECADWNDALDMAKEHGESVAFTCMYAYNLDLLSKLLKKLGRSKIKIAQELKILLKKINYNRIKAKQSRLEDYFAQTKYIVSGKKIDIDTYLLSCDLKNKSQWLMNHIRNQEWLKEGFFNGYYDNAKKRVEGKKNNIIRMTLVSQVFPIMAKVASYGQITEILKSVHKYLFDKNLKGYHLNTDFKSEYYNLGRAFSFVYGDKENGAFFNHMVVMFAYALYRAGFAREGWQVLKSIYDMAINATQSKIYPCLPEYFNLEGKGMYSYLTGSASWLVLTILTETFGLKGKNGNLLIEPKLCSEQFKDASIISITRTFAQRRFKVNFINPKRLTFGKYNIVKARLNQRNLLFKLLPNITIERKTITRLPKDKINVLDIFLG